MKTRIVPIGNSKGVRLPKALLDLCHIRDAVNLSVKGDMIVIQPLKHHPRAGWEAAFRRMHERGEDRLLIPDSLDLDFESWEW